MKNLIRCPSCETEGKINVLGEIDNQGHFLVLRFHNGITRIIGDSFTVVCDHCSEPIYIKKGGNNLGTVFNYRKSWLHRFSLGSSFGTIRA